MRSMDFGNFAAVVGNYYWDTVQSLVESSHLIGFEFQGKKFYTRKLPQFIAILTDVGSFFSTTDSCR